MRDVTVDEIFTWREDFGLKAKESFGAHRCYANMKTYAEIKSRCDEIERKTQAWMNPFIETPPLNGVMIHIDDSVPDGILRGKEHVQHD